MSKMAEPRADHTGELGGPGHKGRARLFVAISVASVAMQAAAWGVLIWVTGVLKLGYSFADISDIRTVYFPYATKMAAGLIPFRDFSLEYPPLFLPLLLAAGYTPNREAYVDRFALEMICFSLVAGAVTAFVYAQVRSGRTLFVVAAVYAVSVLALGSIVAQRYDAPVAVAIALALFFLVRRRWIAVGIALGIGFALKITPVVLLPLVVLLAARKRIPAALGAFTVFALAPFAVVAGWGGSSTARLAALFTVHSGRALNIDSVLASIFWVPRLFGGPLVPIKVGGSMDVALASADAVARGSVVLVVVLLTLVFALVWRRRASISGNPSYAVLACLATVLAALVGSKVLSPQYFVWLMPFAALVAVDRRLLAGLLLASMTLTHVLIPANYPLFHSAQPMWLVAVVLARNFLLVVCFALSVWYLWTLPRRPNPASSGQAPMATA